MKNQRGFTLIEMMVTVAVIVVLSAGATTAISTYIGHANLAASGVSAHNNKYSAAQSEVNTLSGNAISGGTTAETQAPTTPTSTAPTSTAPTSTAPTSTAPTSTAPTSTAPTSTAPTSTAPTSTAPTSTTPTSATTPAATTTIKSAWSPYAYGAEIAIPNVDRITTITITLPKGAVATSWYNCTIISQNNTANSTTLKISVPANQTNPAFLVKYSGKNAYTAVVTTIS